MMYLKPEKLFVEFRDGVTPLEPVLGRKYTLTHSDQTAELFLTIGKNFAYDKITLMRDEVLGQWNLYDRKYIFNTYVYVGGELGKKFAQMRYNIFKRELPLALEAIRYGDRELFKEHPFLNKAPIYVHFDSIYPEINSFENFGTFSEYE